MGNFKKFLGIAQLVSLILTGLTFAVEEPKELSAEVNEYGTIYLAEQKVQKVYPWRAGVQSNYEFGNPYSDIYGLTTVVEHSLGQFVWLGIQASYFISSRTDLTEVLKNDLSLQGVSIQTEVPRYSVYPIATFIPLTGYFNFIGNRPLKADLALRVGVGSNFYKGKSRLGSFWSIRPILYLNPQWGIQMGIGQEIESPFNRTDRISHFQGDLGLSVQF
jgi:hypothetical protein